MQKLLKNIPLPNSAKLSKLIAQHNRRYSEYVISEQARADAAIGIPQKNSASLSPFENRLKEEMIIIAGKITTQYRLALEMLDARIKAEESFMDKSLDRTQDVHSTHSEIEEEVIVNANAIKYAIKQLELAEQRYNAMYDRIGRGPAVYIPQWLYWFFATAIFIGEIPLNALVFAIFGENQVMTWVMAFVIGLSVPLSAHFIGIMFRVKSEGLWCANYFKGLISLSVICAALYGLSTIRTSYLSAFKTDLGLTDQLVQSTSLFFWLNIAVLGAAIVISYLAHDPNPGFETSKHEYQIARKRMEKLEHQRLKKLKQSRARKIKSFKNSDQEHRNELNTINYLKGYYDMLLKEGQGLEQQCLAGLRHDIELYRQENLRCRERDEVPKSFSMEVAIPFHLHILEEKLLN
jgi:hypothetical protein